MSFSLRPRIPLLNQFRECTRKWPGYMPYLSAQVELVSAGRFAFQFSTIKTYRFFRLLWSGNFPRFFCFIFSNSIFTLPEGARRIVKEVFFHIQRTTRMNKHCLFRVRFQCANRRRRSMLTRAFCWNSLVFNWTGGTSACQLWREGIKSPKCWVQLTQQWNARKIGTTWWFRGIKGCFFSLS